ncbi:unnamed protein product [[Candida] boidinii]|nr:unnamed protein product [[Candida] boidinii]
MTLLFPQFTLHADACGSTSTSEDYVVAIAESLYTSLGTSNEWISSACGKMINASYNGKKIQVKVVDACASCSTYDLDFSPAAFGDLADLSVGVIQVTWEWAT